MSNEFTTFEANVAILPSRVKTSTYLTSQFTQLSNKTKFSSCKANAWGKAIFKCRLQMTWQQLWGVKNSAYTNKHANSTNRWKCYKGNHYTDIWGKLIKGTIWWTVNQYSNKEIYQKENFWFSLSRLDNCKQYPPVKCVNNDSQGFQSCPCAEHGCRS